MFERSGTQQSGRLRLCDFIDRHRELIMARWEEVSRSWPEAQPLSGTGLRDHIPRILDRISSHIRAVQECSAAPVDEVATLHAVERLEVGFDLRLVAREVALLRSIILALWEEQAEREARAGAMIQEIRELDTAIDEVIGASIQAYATARERTLSALERLSAASLGSEDVNRFIPRLIEVFLQTTAAADMVKVFLKDRDRLVLEATGGVDAREPDVTSMWVGEGFAGAAARDRAPRLTHSAVTDPGVADPGIRSRGIKALYAVPMMQDGEAIGVAEMGSCTAFDFSEDDKQLFRAMVQRVSSLVVQRQLIDVVKRSEARLRRVADSVPALLFECDAAGACTWVSDAWRAYTGQSAEEALGWGWLGARRPEDRASAAQAWAEAAGRGLPFEARQQIRAADGTYRWFLIRVRPDRDAGGNVVGWFGSASDVDGLTRTEHELEEARDFERQLMGIVSHDLRTPLTAILMAANAVLRRHDLDNRLRTTVERIISSGSRASRMIRDLLDSAQLRLAGAIPVHRRPLDLAEFLSQVVDEVRLGYPHRTVRVHRAGDASGSWDPDRMAQIITNLVGNALEHSPDGTPVDVGVTGQDGKVLFTVHNQGAPIPADELPTLFDAFTRGKRRACKGGGQGVGLGLFITKRLVDAKGGMLSVESNAEDGTTFTVRLPRIPPSPESA